MIEVQVNIDCADASPHALIDKLADSAEFPGAVEVIRIDGLRVEYPDGFGLMRASNTTPIATPRSTWRSPRCSRGRVRARRWCCCGLG